MRGCLLIIILMSATISRAQIHTEFVDYGHEGKELQGYLTYDENLEGPRPGVLVFHEWWGMNDYAQRRARELAELGYIAFACDMYGKGVVTDSWEEAPKLAGPFYEDRSLMRERGHAGYEILTGHELCDASRVGAIGYCFGGTCALELARHGTEIQGVVSFHGGLNTPAPEDAKNIQCPVLVCHGADDRFVDSAEVASFETEMRDAGVDWQLNSYGSAVHSFSNSANDNDPSDGVAYNEKADKRSWAAMKAFFREAF